MRVSSLIGFLFFCSILFSSCDDDLRSVGGNIQPGGDDVLLEVDSFNVSAKTVEMGNIYVRNTTGLLGRYEDDTYGTVLSEYLTEFACPDSLYFRETFNKVDSTKILVAFQTYVGDSIAPMGVSFYQLTKKLDKNYYTNVNPANYCDMSKLLASTSYTIRKTAYESTSSKVRIIEANMGDWGQKLYEATKTSNNPLASSQAFLKYFPGVYVKSSFGNGSMVNVLGTTIAVYYTTKRDTVVTDPETGLVDLDSVMYTSRSLFLSSTSEVNQQNRVVNKIPTSLLAQNTGAVYIKSPAGVYAEIELPIKDIIDKTSGENSSKAINMARLKLKGFTEVEQKGKYPLDRPTTLLLINKDSVDSFFQNPYRVADLSSSLIYAANRDASTNTYTFSNLAPMIRKYREDGLTTNPKFLLVPVTAETISTSSSSTVIGYFNSMKPAVAVIRAKEGDIKLEMIYSTF